MYDKYSGSVKIATHLDNIVIVKQYPEQIVHIDGPTGRIDGPIGYAP